MHPLQIVVHKERIIQAVVHLLFYYIFFFFFFFFQFALFSLCWVFARFSVTKVSSQAWNYASCNLTCRQNHLTPRWLHCLLCGPHCGPAVAPALAPCWYRRGGPPPSGVYRVNVYLMHTERVYCEQTQINNSHTLRHTRTHTHTNRRRFPCSSLQSNLQP